MFQETLKRQKKRTKSRQQPSVSAAGKPRVRCAWVYVGMILTVVAYTLYSLYLYQTPELSEEVKIKAMVLNIQRQSATHTVDYRCKDICTYYYQTDSFPVGWLYFKNQTDFIGPDSFRDMADVVFMWPWTKQEQVLFERENLTQLVKCLAPVPIIYVKSEYLSWLTEHFLPLLPTSYILITGQSDSYNPVSTMRFLLNKPQMIQWFGQNPKETHSAFSPIPIGIKYSLHGRNLQKFMTTTNPSVLEKDATRNMKEVLRERSNITSPTKKLLLLAFNKRNDDLRRNLYDYFCVKAYVTCQEYVNQSMYYATILRHPFVLSPPGVGIDSYRTWETLYLGRIPVVLHSHLDSLYSHLPVLVLHDLTSASEHLLHTMLQVMSDRKYSYHALSATMWQSNILQIRAQAHRRLRVTNPPPRARCWGPRHTSHEVTTHNTSWHDQ